MDPLYAYILLVALIACQRLWEMKKSARNTEALLNRGAVEIGAEHYPVMAMLHGSWLVACLLEATSQTSAPSVGIVVVCLGLLAAGQCLRLLAMSTLGPRWTTRIIVLPEADVVDRGIFRYLRHPNYLGVILEIFALPMVFGGWITAVGFTIANGLLLWLRIKTEEAALSTECDYQERLGNHNRFIPTGPKS